MTAGYGPARTELKWSGAASELNLSLPPENDEKRCYNYYYTYPSKLSAGRWCHTHALRGHASARPTNRKPGHVYLVRARHGDADAMPVAVAPRSRAGDEPTTQAAAAAPLPFRQLLPSPRIPWFPVPRFVTALIGIRRFRGGACVRSRLVAPPKISDGERRDGFRAALFVCALPCYGDTRCVARAHLRAIPAGFRVPSSILCCFYLIGGPAKQRATHAADVCVAVTRTGRTSVSIRFIIMGRP